MATYGFNEVYGYDIYVETVYRRNGTKENCSLRIDLMNWHRSSGHSIYRVKFSIKDSKKKIIRLKKINKKWYLFKRFYKSHICYS